jgi:hypothetical protein
LGQEMAAREKAKSRFTFTRRIAPEPMTAADYAESKRIIAKLIARAFIADNPHLFAPQQDQSEHSTICRAVSPRLQPEGAHPSGGRPGRKRA